MCAGRFFVANRRKSLKKGETRLAITRTRKEELVAIYGEMLRHSSGFVVTEFRNMPMAKVNELRARLRPINGAYVVTKNTLFTIALRNAGWPVPENLLVGPVATGFADGGNVAALAKAMLAFEKENPGIFMIKGGVAGTSVLTPAQVQMISELPSLEELRAQIAGLIVQPASGLLGVLNAATGSIVNVLDAFVQKNTSGEAA